jgi:hypothetical protein
VDARDEGPQKLAHAHRTLSDEAVGRSHGLMLVRQSQIRHVGEYVETHFLAVISNGGGIKTD